MGWRDLTIRTRAVLVGVALVAVPTAFGAFPELGDWPPVVRGLVGLVWIAIAVTAVLSTVEREARVEALVTEEERERRQVRRRASEDLLEAFLRPGTKGVPRQYEFAVHVYDDMSDVLRQWYPTVPSEVLGVKTFAPGRGVTGASWLQETTVVVTEDAVSDTRLGLTPAQQDFYRPYRVAAATPIWVEGETPVGVLGVIGTENDGYFQTPAGQALLREVADVIGVLLRSIPDPADVYWRS